MTPRDEDMRQALDKDKQLQDRLDQLLEALELHRLTFLFFARATRLNPQNPKRNLTGSLWETIEHIDWEPQKVVDDGRSFLNSLRSRLDEYAERARAEFGSGEGCPAKDWVDGQFYPVEGGSLPHWQIDPQGAAHLSDSSQRLSSACMKLAETSHPELIAKASSAAFGVMYQSGQSAWTSSTLVVWEYLEQLDSAIHTASGVKLQIAGRGTGSPTPWASKRDWAPPLNHIGSNTITIDCQVPRTTLQNWHEKDLASGKLEKIEKDPQTGENYYPTEWLENRLKTYKPRKKR